MRYQIFGMKGRASEASIAAYDEITTGEIALLDFLNQEYASFTWTSWQRSDVDAFQTITAGQIQCTVRKMRRDRWRSDQRWLCFRIDAEQHPFWYYLEVIDHLGRYGRKQISAFAATDGEDGYQQLDELFNKLCSLVPANAAPSEPAGFMPAVAFCAATYPVRKICA